MSDLAQEPEFVRQGVIWASPESERDTEAARMRYEAVMGFVAAWEALQLPDTPGEIIDRRWAQLVGRWVEIEFQGAYLARLARF